MSPEKSSMDKDTQKAKVSPDTALQFVQDVTDKLTLGKIFIVLLFGILGTVLTLTYENRALVFQKVLAATKGSSEITGWELSDSTKAQMVGMARGSQWINMVLITEIDLQKNRRIPKYWFLDSPQEPTIKNRTTVLFPQPVFDLDAKNTQQMIGILNNEFVCNPIEDTVFFKLFPELQKEMPYICRLSIPPFYGRFVGILTVGLRKVPTKDELEQVRIDLARFSVEVYLNDVTKKSKPLILPGH
jgi:hypothetical protein